MAKCLRARLRIQMNRTDPNLSYECYFLLRTEFEHDGRIWHEPKSLTAFYQSSITTGGIIVDHDNRLFRWDASTNRPPNSVPLEDWPKVLKRGWKNVQFCYMEHFDGQDVDRIQAEFFSNRALAGVAVVIHGIRPREQTRHVIRIPLRTNDSLTPEETAFRLAPEDSPDREWLTICHTDDEGRSEPVCFGPFHSDMPTRCWQLKLDSALPGLAPMQHGKNMQNPVFAVYALMHTDLAGDSAQNDAWSDELHDFFVGKGEALLVDVIPRLIVRRWHSARMDKGYRDVRHALREQSMRHNLTDTDLRCLSIRTLSEGLQGMAAREAEATDLLESLEKAVITLKNSRDHLERKLTRASKRHPRFDLIWHEEGALDSFDSDIRQLQDHIAYLRGDIVCLDRIRNRWRIHFDSRQLAASDHMAVSASVLTIIAAIATLIAILPTHLASPAVQFFKKLQTTPLLGDAIMFLSNPTVLWGIIMLGMWPMIWFLAKTMMRRVRFWWWMILRRMKS